MAALVVGRVGLMGRLGQRTQGGANRASDQLAEKCFCWNDDWLGVGKAVYGLEGQIEDDLKSMRRTCRLLIKGES